MATPHCTGLQWLLSADNVPTHPLSLSVYLSAAYGGAELMDMHEKHLKMLVHYEPSKHNLKQIEATQHQLIHAGWAMRVHGGALRALKQASLLLELNAFSVVSNRIDSVSDPLHRFYLPKYGLALKTHAFKIHKRPVARRWRRVIRFLRWVARIPKWLPAFNEMAFKPEAMAVEHVAKRFKLAASTLQAVA